jgi:hypothetical protein
MRKLFALICFAALVGMVVGTALAADEKATTYSGTVVKVDDKVLVLSVKEGDKTNEMKILTGEKTEITLDGKAAKLEDLKADMTAVVTMAPAGPGASPVATMAAKIEAKCKAVTKG